MIAQISGKLTDLNNDSAYVQVGQITYEIMLPGYCISQLSGKINSEITLCTTEYYEGTPGGGNLIPRMVGFVSPAERDFFKTFTSVKGIGIRKGLKCLAMPIATIAAAIENSDEKTLSTLPSVGKRLAQQIIAQLKGKLSKYALDESKAAGDEQQTFEAYQAETLEILVAWGEKRIEAMELIQAACKKHPDVKTAEQLVPIVYRIKQGIEV